MPSNGLGAYLAVSIPIMIFGATAIAAMDCGSVMNHGIVTIESGLQRARSELDPAFDFGCQRSR